MSKTVNTTPGRKAAEDAAKAPFLPLLRELVRTYQAFQARDAASLARYDLTAPQADVIFTLGNTVGMTFKEIGTRTLTSKGTLTGIIERLEKKGLVARKENFEDARSWIVFLTRRGEDVFHEVFPAHIATLAKRFERIDATTRRRLVDDLITLKAAFE